MSRGELSSPVEVRVGACLCEGTPHPDGDVVFLAAKFPTSAGHAATRALALGGDLEVTVLAAILRHGAIESWNFTDAKGDDVAPTPANVDRYLPWNEGGRLVAAAARKHYMEEGNGPFSYSSTSKQTSRRSSPSTPTAKPTSRTRRSSSKRPRSSALRSVPDSDGVPSAVSP